MVTAQKVFEITMHLMDEGDSQTGNVNTADTLEYKNRSLAIMNLLANELYPFSDTYRSNSAGFRPIPHAITKFEQSIQLDDYILESVMPYGLAAHLLLTEDPTSANFFQQRYEELKRDAARGLPAVSEDIIDLYGGIEPYNNFGRW